MVIFLFQMPYGRIRKTPYLIEDTLHPVWLPLFDSLAQLPSFRMKNSGAEVERLHPLLS